MPKSPRRPSATAITSWSLDIVSAKKVPVLNREIAISSDDDLLSRIETAAATIRANNYYGGAAILPIHFGVEHPILGSANNALFIRCVNAVLIEVTAKIEAFGFATTVHRFKGSSGWGPFEYENPPMALGVEYRTTERYFGKPVYVMAVYFGALPNTTSKTLWSTPAANVYTIIDYGGEGAGYALPYDGTNYIKFTCSLTGSNVVSVTVTTGADYSSYNATIWFKYTKTTD